jgi:hypothetical protein
MEAVPEPQASGTRQLAFGFLIAPVGKIAKKE